MNGRWSPGSRWTSRPVEFIAILGRNGCGKTLTLHTLAGLRPPMTGTVELAGQLLNRLSRRHIAQRMGLLTQDLEDGFVSTVMESLLIGRHPHLSLLEQEGPEDRRLALTALTKVGLLGFEDRTLETLSGGEQRRCAMAALLTQDPQVFLLDEPSNHLDPQQQLAVLGLFKDETQRGRTVIAILHDPRWRRASQTRPCCSMVMAAGSRGRPRRCSMRRP